jgi:hypothetical protein
MMFFSNLLDDLQDVIDLTDSFLHIYDAVTPEDVKRLVARQGKPAVILNDHMTLDYTIPSDIKGCFLPLFAQSQASLWQPEDFDLTPPDTQTIFCVMSNKKTLTRSLCLRMIEIMGFKNFAYTWSGLGRSTDMAMLIAELDALGTATPLSQDERHALLGPIELPARMVGDVSSNNDFVFEYGGNRKAWDQGLDQMFLKSAISLITETFVPNRESIFTEKTVYSVLGLNFPIWIGGFGQAQNWKKFGFDIFDDIIDHSYQNKSTLIERCWYAFEFNRDILNDFDRAKKLREQNVDRLLRNRDLLLSGRLLDYSLQQIDLMPSSYQAPARECVRLVCQV